MKSNYWIVIVANGAEPMGVEAHDASDVRRMLGDVALCAATTKAALLRAGWTESGILRDGMGPSVVCIDRDEPGMGEYIEEVCQ